MTAIFFTLLFACQNSDNSNSNPNQPPTTTPDNTNTQNPPPKNNTQTPPPKNNTTTQKPPVDSVKGLPDLLKNIVTDGCDNGPGVYGAADYFHNVFEISSSGTVSGTETWILYANQKLKSKWEKEGFSSPCKVTWTLKGKTQDATRGDLGLNLVNNLVDTTCPKEMVNKYEDTGKTINYNVVRKPDGTAQVFFKSGKEVGQGHHNSTHLQFITNKSCRWF